MDEWSKLSMADRAKYIKIAIDNGITDINNIRDTYTEYALGGKVNKFDGTGDSTIEKQSTKQGLTLMDRVKDITSAYLATVNPLWLLNKSIRGRVSNIIFRNTEGIGEVLGDGASVVTGGIRPQYYDGNVHFIEDPEEYKKTFDQTNFTTYDYSKNSPLELYTKGDFSKETPSPYGKGIYTDNPTYGKLDAYLGNIYGDTIYMHPNQKPYVDKYIDHTFNIDKDDMMKGADMRYLEGTVDSRHHYITPKKDTEGNYTLFMEDVWDTKPILDMFNYPYIYNQNAVLQFTEDKDKLDRIPNLSTLFENIGK